MKTTKIINHNDSIAEDDKVLVGDCQIQISVIEDEVFTGEYVFVNTLAEAEEFTTQLNAPAAEQEAEMNTDEPTTEVV
jgi:hypothetical protein